MRTLRSCFAPRIELAAAAGLVVGMLAAPAHADDAEGPHQAGDCAPVYPLEEVERGQPITGLTVSQGTEPETFAGTIIGVLDDGIALDVDMILADLSSSALSQAGGVWAGMSGSPVYAADGRLVGAVAYGLAAAPSSIAGITPAHAMVALRGDTEADAVEAQQELASSPLPRAMREAVAATGSATHAQAAQGMRRLPMALGISSLSPTRIDQLAEVAPDYGIAPFATSAAAATAAGEPDAIKAGGNFAAALAYGDVTAAGIGTTTTVCHDSVLAFGHPLLHSGPTSLSAHTAEALYVQPDAAFAPFKVANVGGGVGTVVEDRLAGVLATLGPLPEPVPVASTVSDGEASRTGTTLVNRDEDVPDMTGAHLLANLDRVLDLIGPGEVALSWIVRGDTPNGPWTLERSNRYASQEDVAFESVFELVGQLSQIESNPFTPATFDTVEIDARVGGYQSLQVTGVAVAVGGGDFVPADELGLLQVPAGATLALRVEATPYRGTTPIVLELALAIPGDVVGAGGEVVVSGGGEQAGLGGPECLFEPELCEPEGGNVDSFEALLANLATQPRNDEVVAQLELFGAEEQPTVVSDRADAPAVVTGFQSLPVVITEPE